MSVLVAVGSGEVNVMKNKSLNSAMYNMVKNRLSKLAYNSLNCQIDCSVA